ncbi:class I SAM-dependent methyltransferase [Pinisolibacter sp.]|uniref:class I SAM-dependent methyltransferase n=1 Tax=Pinisolibacter sp. TaxID=2172024 RepID=UPI002FDE8375
MSESAAPAINPHGHGRASDWVERFLPGVAASGTVLDLACGAGRHLRRALTLGHPVVGLDRDVSGLADLEGRGDVEIVVHDLEAPGGLDFPWGTRRFAGVIVTNYLFRPLLTRLADLVAEDGILIYETFARGQERFGKPSNPDFMLAPNELLRPETLGDLVVVGFEQGELPAEFTVTRAPKIVQRLAAVGPEHPWAHAAPRRLGGI